MKIILGADHGGFDLKTALIAYLRRTRPDWDIEDAGVFTPHSVDYPDFAKIVAESIHNKQSDLGVLCCGTGIGMSMMANRYASVRAAVVHDVYTAQMAKAHNNANVLCLGGRTTTPQDAELLLDIWLDTTFEEGRHTRRINKLDSPTSSASPE